MIFSNYHIILLFGFLAKCVYCKNFELRKREKDVFSNVPLWTLKSNGFMSYKGNFANDHIVCEDPDEGAIFMPIYECENVDECKLRNYTGVYGNKVTLQYVNRGKRHCLSRTKREILNSNYLINIIDDTDFTNVVGNVQQRKGIYVYVDSKWERRQKHRVTRSVGNAYWDRFMIKLLIVIDYTLYHKFDRDLEYIAQYMNIFWSSVNLKFKSIHNPRISLKIVGIIVAEESNSLRYIDTSQFYEYDNTTLDINLAITKFDEIKYYLNNSNVITPKYNAIITVTGLTAYNDYDLCLGIAYRGGICNSKENGAIIIDDAAFFGINNAVHELGHLLGLKHDGDKDEDEAVSFYKCNNNKSGLHSIMHPKNPGNFDEFRWSECSLGYFHLIQTYESMKCIGQ